MQYITQCVLAYGRSHATRTLRVHHATTFYSRLLKNSRSVFPLAKKH
jgi:hypothetical protein